MTVEEVMELFASTAAAIETLGDEAEDTWQRNKDEPEHRVRMRAYRESERLVRARITELATYRASRSQS
jgi:hypothetical protein